MVEYKTHEKKVIKYGENNFIELGLRTSTNDKGQQSNFIGVNRGYINKDGELRYMKGGLSIPHNNKKLSETLTKELTRMTQIKLKEPKQPKKTKTTEKETKTTTPDSNKRLQKQINDLKDSMDEQKEVNQKLLEFISKKSKKNK